MKALLILVFCFITSGQQPQIKSEVPVEQENITTYYFIRHAEKEGSDPSNRDPQLSAAGQERAQKWAKVFKDVTFDRIYSSNYSRTLSTASAIAESQKKEVEIYDPKKLFDPEFQEKTKGKIVLVVGHSNTNPTFVNQILGADKYQDLDEKEYSSLFIVTIGANGEKTSQVLYID